MLVKRFSLFVLVLLATSTLPGAPETLELKLTRLDLYKNGLGVFTCEGEVPHAAGTYELAAVPPSSHGTIWVTVPQGVRVAGLVSFRGETTAKALTMRDLIRANEGRQAAIRLTAPELKIYGRIMGMIKLTESEIDPYGRRRDYPSGPESTAVLVQGSDHDWVVATARIAAVEFREALVRDYLVSEPRLRLRFTKVRAGERFELTYLAKGVTWAPSYRVELGNKEQDKVRLRASAVVVNEVIDLEGVRLGLMTGTPNLQLADVVSPLSLDQSLADFLKTLGQDPQDRHYGQYSTQAGTYYSPGSGRGLPQYAAATSHASHEDLHLTPLEVTLARGSTGWYPLFDIAVPYEHVYRWEIQDYVTKEGRYSRSSEPDPSSQSEVVWHSIRLSNTSDSPWTTAPAQSILAGVLLGQDMLPYTPPGASSLVRVTRAVNVRVEEAEYEQSRQRIEGYGRSHSNELVQLEGEIRAANLLDKAIVLEIVKNLSGEVLTTAPDSTVVRLGKGLKRDNPQLQLTWRLELEPGAEQVVQYSYQVIIRR